MFLVSIYFRSTLLRLSAMFLPSSALLSREYKELVQQYDDEKVIEEERGGEGTGTQDASNKDKMEPLDKVDTSEDNGETEQEEALFDPPLYKQRYSTVANIINKHKAKFVIDMGCSEGQFISKVKDLCPTVEKCIGVDVDKIILQSNCNRLKPFTIEYILKREVPLMLSMYNGSISEPDVRFRGADVIACIEVIEHLYDETLDKVPQALFGVLSPKLIVITTPNSEYNVLFKDFSGMRHYDHKFEWTRKEFETWCCNIVKEYPYDLEISGIGDPPPESEVGFCSQMAVFTRKIVIDEEDKSGSLGNCIKKVNNPIDSNIEVSEYELVYEVNYPYNDINKNKNSRIISETDYIINHFFSDVSDETEETFIRNIPIDELLLYPGLKKFDLTKEEFLNQVKEKYVLSDDRNCLAATFKLSDFIRDSWYSDGSDDLDLDGNVALAGIQDECHHDEIEENWDL